MVYDVVIVGAGASGIMLASILKTKNSKLNVLILEKNKMLGKKLSITGNGRCNLGNLNTNINNFNSNSNLKRFEKYLNTNKDINLELLEHDLNNKNYIDYLKDFGILIKEENKLLYPYSNQALSVCKSFERYLDKVEANIKYEYEVFDIKKTDNIFIINNEIESKNVVIATGGMSYKNTGSTGDGYKLLSKLGHKITKLYPSLVGLKTDYKYIKDISGVRFDCRANLSVDNVIIKEEKGQVQFGCDYLSGICVFNLSNKVKEYLDNKKDVKIIINFVPNYSSLELLNYIKYFSDYKIEDALSCIINNKLATSVCKTLKILEKKVSYLSNDMLEEVIFNLQNMYFNIIDTKDINEAQVTKGGASLDDFDDNLESNKVKGLYAIGEVVDVDGKCGGYNLMWAFTSALIASDKLLV